MAISQPSYPSTTAAVVTHVGSYVDAREAAEATARAAVASDLAAHLADTTDAHDATAVSISAIDGEVWANVQVALQALKDLIDAGGGGGSGNGLPATIQAKTTTYTALAGDFVKADASTAGFTVTLPAAPATGALVAVKKVDSTSNTVTIAPSGGGTIDGDANATTATEMAGAIFEHVGSNVWHIVASMATTGPAGEDGTDGANGTNATVSTVEDEGVALTARASLNFVGAGVTAADSGGKTVVTIPGGGGGSASGLTLPTGRYVAMPGSLATVSVGLGEIFLSPFVVPASTTIDQILCEITTVGTGAVRMGVYADSGGLPGALSVAASTQPDIGSTGIKSATISGTLAAGLYWVALCFQGSAGPQCRATNQIPLIVSSTSTAGAISNSCAGLKSADALTSGALPSSLTAPFSQQVSGPRIGFHVA